MPSPDDVQALKEFALLGAVQGFVEISSSMLAKRLGTSQQTASRRMLELERSGYLKREKGVRRQLVRLSEEGVGILLDELGAYKRIFDERDKLAIKGRVVSGLGEGRYYLNQPGYLQQFAERLGIKPFPGTLNLEIRGGELNKLRILKASPSIVIDAFTAGDRTFGAVDAWRCRVRDLECAVIIPRRTHHSRTLEIIAADHLREKFSLADGQEIQVEVKL